MSTSHTNPQTKVVVITGASSGIGETAALALAQAGHIVVLGARRQERLAALADKIRAAGGTAAYLETDVTSKAQVDALVGLAREQFGRVDVIVNNAGVMPLSAMQELKLDEWERMVDVNIKGVLYGIAAGLPIMKAQGSGHFINVSSIGGHAVYPTAAVYCATKYAVRAISEGLRQEQLDGDIRVTIISPGVVESELAESISDPAARAAMREFRQIALKPDAIARALVYAIEQPADVDVSEIIIRPTQSPY
ncbi:SDR family oxidoreductase [Cellvibrio sp. pealriver]|uniref:SDR family oxidoreductase n=1 Tax=Cellvibrio sp. pealriver TaxID=1622269 RepID=UPI00066FD9F8|nr:SDR family oxidoreductase [Cellvibrio sp. pealriver]